MLSAFCALAFFSVDAAASDGARLGIWITVFSPHKVLYSQENADRLIEYCEKTGINDIYLQVYRSDEAYYDSSLTDRSHYERMLSDSGRDMLSYIIKKAQARGISVHAWINLLSVSRNSDANILRKLGKDALAVDQHGRTASPDKNKDELDNYYIREGQIFLDPGDVRVRKYLTLIAGELASRYPGLAGIHLDYVRYPTAVPFIPGSRFTSHGISYGYGAASARNFEKATGLDPRTMEHSRKNFGLWDDWKRDQVSSLVEEVSIAAREAAPGIKISCAVMPSPYRAYLTAFQDWEEWLRNGHADYVVAMNYTDDPRLMELNTSSLLMADVEDRVYVGIGAYLLKKNPDDIVEQLSRLSRLEPAGIVLFSYDDIYGNDVVTGFLKNNFKRESVRALPVRQPSSGGS